MSMIMKQGKFLTVAFVGAFIFVSGALQADADSTDRRIRIFNDTAYDIFNLYFVDVRMNWAEDILGSDILGVGQSVLVIFDDGTDSCIYDITAVFEDGEILLASYKNVCELSSFHFTN